MVKLASLTSSLGIRITDALKFWDSKGFKISCLLNIVSCTIRKPNIPNKLLHVVGCDKTQYWCVDIGVVMIIMIIILL